MKAKNELSITEVVQMTGFSRGTILNRINDGTIKSRTEPSGKFMRVHFILLTELKKLHRKTYTGRPKI